ncbi:MAG: hypothetical protein EAZ85_04540 [Bacteroidetes bacterium]|nr:MAG: hypothetical protein EAZ85_04540 [Bacteroidota bacterium]TAG90720.1 MAG: hypothetical protein EAZ20_03800 [Bacteroidota bacterium]
MLFETEKKADNFIAFNQEEIMLESGVAPQRSYFCVFCGGWHITSIKDKFGMSKNEQLLEDYLAKKVEKKIIQNIKVNDKNKKNDIILELENQIKVMNFDEMKVFFSQQISFLKEEIQKYIHPIDISEKEKRQEARQKLEIIYVLRKKNGLNTNNCSEKLAEQKLEDWKQWLEKKGY